MIIQIILSISLGLSILFNLYVMYRLMKIIIELRSTITQYGIVKSSRRRRS